MAKYPNDPDYSYVNENGKRVSGAPAFLHQVYTEKGGVQKYNDEIGAEYIKAFVKEHSDVINKEISHKARRDRLKMVK